MRHGIVALHQRIQEFMQRDRLIALKALAEIIALEHARHRVARGDFDQARRIHRPEPARVEIDPRRVRIENLVDLLLVGARVGLDLLRREPRARRVAAGRDRRSCR